MSTVSRPAAGGCAQLICYVSYAMYMQDVRMCKSWKCGVISQVQPRQSMHIYLKNNPVEFHPDPVWSYWALGFSKSVLNKKIMSSDMG